ncbi:MAG TPA: ABC transporter permease [Chryseosolibacter sp.]
MGKSKPPRLAEHLLQWYSERAQIDDLQGDIEELFYEDVKRYTVGRAKFNYWQRVISLIFSYAMTKRKRDAAYHYFSTPLINPAMFKNYFKTATRNLSKNKFFTTLNVFGLALGMSLNLLFVAMIVFIFQFENFHANKEKIYRVITHVRDQGENPSFASAPIGTAQLLKENFSGLDNVVRIHGSGYREVRYRDTKFSLNKYFVDAEYLSMFTFPLVQGNHATSLAKPNTMVITQSAAARVFGDKDPMGEVVFIEPYGEVMVTGVAADMPKNTHLKVEALVSFATLTSHYGASFTDDEKNWNNFYNAYTYLQLADNTSPAAIEAFLNRVAKEKYRTAEFQASFELQPLNKIVPGPQLDNNLGNEWSYEEMLLMGVIPMLILLAAGSNYVSLAVSQSLRRMKEIGVRKVMGGQKGQIFMQFVMESTIIMLLAVTLSYFFFEIIREETLSITGELDSINLNPTVGTFAGFVVFALMVGVVAGIVPALHFSKVGPIHALKGKELQTKSGSRFTLRKIVIISQFVLSLGFTMAIAIMVQQHRYSVNYNFGFDQEKILNVELQQADPQLVKNQFEKLSFIPLISMSSHPLGVGDVPKLYVKQIDKADSLDANWMAIDENFIANMGMHLVLGSNFTSAANDNSHSIIINETFAKKLNPADPAGAIDRVLILPDKREVNVIGILKDFHYASLRSPIGNFFFQYAPANFRYANFHFESTNKQRAFAEMENAWKPVGNGTRFKSEFLTDQIHDAYSFYNGIVKMWGFMGLLAITIACLGLLGTVVFTVKNRVKEVSIRKVMGASSQNLVYLLSKDFIALLGIAAVIAIPTVYVLMDLMLQEGQYYHAPIGYVEIVISLAVVLVLGLTTIFSQTLKAANTNPVDNLRVE